MASKKKKRAAPPPPARSKPPRAAAAPLGPTRKEQERAARAQQERSDRLRRRLATGGLAVAAVAVVGTYVFVDRSRDAELRQALTSGSCEVDEDSDKISGGDGHVQAPTYEVNPPAGGDHLSSVARSGVYSGTAVPPDGQLVHALEHGYVVVWHGSDLPAEQLEQLERLKEQRDPDVIVAERPSLPVPVAATAWNRRLLCQEVEPDALNRFVDEHVGNGPEDVDRT